MTMPASTVARLTLSSDVQQLGASLTKVRELVAALASAANLAPSTTYRLRLASDEIVTNIITHGYAESGRQGTIEITATISENQVALALSDTAVPYNPLEQAAPADLDAPLEARREGGLGVYLAVHSVDEFRYEHVDGYNRNTLVMKREPGA